MMDLEKIFWMKYFQKLRYSCLGHDGHVRINLEVYLKVVWAIRLALKCFFLFFMCVFPFKLIDTFLVCICPSLSFAYRCFHLLVVFLMYRYVPRGYFDLLGVCVRGGSCIFCDMFFQKYFLSIQCSYIIKGSHFSDVVGHAINWLYYSSFFIIVVFSPPGWYKKVVQ